MFTYLIANISFPSSLIHSLVAAIQTSFEKLTSDLTESQIWTVIHKCNGHFSTLIKSESPKFHFQNFSNTFINFRQLQDIKATIFTLKFKDKNLNCGQIQIVQIVQIYFFKYSLDLSHFITVYFRSILQK